MSKKQDIRVDNSVKYILEAFRELSKLKRYEELTVSDVTKKSGVSRSTFYRHFASLEDLLKTQIKDDVNYIFNTSYESHTFDFSYESNYNSALEILKFAKENKRVMRVYMNPDWFYPIIHEISIVVNEKVKGLNLDFNDLELKYFCTSLVGSLMLTVRKFLEANCQENIDAISEIFAKSFNFSKKIIES